MRARPTGSSILLALLLAGGARSASEPELLGRVDALLGSYRTVTVAEWRALGSDAAPLLERVARDRAALPTRRARALAALGAVRPAAAGALIRELVAQDTAPVVLRCAAVDAAPGVLGPAAAEVLLPLLGDQEGTLRLRSARVLAASGPGGCRALSTRARTLPTSDPVARTAARCEAQLRASPTSDR